MVGERFYRQDLLAYVLAVTVFVCVCCLGAAAQPKKQENPCKEGADAYLGPGSCSATGCHGRTQAANLKIGERIWYLNEYSTWALQDPHFHSYDTLKGKKSRHIFAILYPDAKEIKPEEDQRCLVCHALAPQNEDKERAFVTEGVSCESCHGPASRWFETHFRFKKEHPSEREWDTPAFANCGLVQLRTVTKRVEKCLDCHLGTDTQEVTHEMIAAGHPDLFFELDLFSAKQPPHWHEENSGAQLWAVGQAVQLQRALERLERRVKAAQLPEGHGHKPWPEFSEYDCFSCHHSVLTNWQHQPGYDLTAEQKTEPPNWRQTTGHNTRTAGTPRWNSAHYAVLLILLKELHFKSELELEDGLKELNKNISALGKPEAVEKNLNFSLKKTADFSLKDAAKDAVATVASAKFDEQMISRLLGKISSQGPDAWQDTRSAEQAYMALDSLFRSYEALKNQPAEKPDSPSPVRKALNELLQQFKSPSAFDANHFADEMKKVHSALREARITQ